MKPGDIVYVHGREACVVRKTTDNVHEGHPWWIITIAGKEMLCPEDIMKATNSVPRE
jgi:hypothetical protein